MPTITDVLKQNIDAGLITIRAVEDVAGRFEQLGQRHYAGKQRASSTQCFEIEVQERLIGMLHAPKLKQNLMNGIQHAGIPSPANHDNGKIFHPYSVSEVPGRKNSFIVSVPNYCDIQAAAMKKLATLPNARGLGA